MKKLFLLFIPLLAMSLIFTSCSDDEEEILDGVALMVFDNYKVISNYEFELSNDSGEMYFDRFSCVNTENKNISDTWDYATHNNVDKKDKFVYMINKDTIFTVTKRGDASFHVKFSGIGHRYNNLLYYRLNFREKDKRNLIYSYPFYHNGKRWCSPYETWHLGEDVVGE